MRCGRRLSREFASCLMSNRYGQDLQDFSGLKSSGNHPAESRKSCPFPTVTSNSRFDLACPPDAPSTGRKMGAEKLNMAFSHVFLPPMFLPAFLTNDHDSSNRELVYCY